ncbi:hypothetical protein V6Z12_D01G176500 [Gossypium hirsutum]
METLSVDELIGSLLTHDMRIKNEKFEKKKVDVALKSTKIEGNKSSDDMYEDKEMTMFAKRFKRFIKSTKGRIFQNKERLKLESTKEKDHIISYECKKSGHIKFDCPHWKKGLSKEKCKANVATWSDEHFFDDEEHEVEKLYLMVIDESKVTSNSFGSTSDSFDELQDAYDEFG